MEEKEVKITAINNRVIRVLYNSYPNHTVRFPNTSGVSFRGHQCGENVTDKDDHNYMSEYFKENSLVILREELHQIIAAAYNNGRSDCQSDMRSILGLGSGTDK